MNTAGADARLWLTRPLPALEKSAALWREAHLPVFAEPVIELAGVDPDPRRVEDLRQRGIGALVAWTSANAVDHFVRVFGRVAAPDVAWRGVAVGEATAERARACGLSVLAVPARATGADLARHLLSGPKPTRVLLPGSEKRREELPRMLRESGVEVDELTLYTNRARANWSAECETHAREGRLRLVVAYSPTAVEAVAGRWEAVAPGVALPPLAALGQTTGEAARARGLEVAVQPAAPGELALREEVSSWWRQQRLPRL